ncbi:hypothetical protein ABZ646_18045 [Streptomyces sp. NPDC007162]|uniref:hypothetical protein n=1 Tax=Streptomyces sp. NPDC007162 TaxID=3156917 RepID=UPI00340A836C
MPTRSQVLRMPASGLDPSAQRRPGTPGQASQHLVNPPVENPTGKDAVRRWLKDRAAADTAMGDARRARDACPEGERAPGDVHELTDTLTRDHDRITALVKQLQALPGAKQGGAPRHLERRESIVDLNVLDDGDRVADEALAQEREGARTLTALGAAAPDSEEFDDLVGQLVDQLRRHVAFEDAVFARLRENLSRKDRERLGEKVVRAWRAAPTRPHPHAPRQPAAAVAGAGTAAAVTDRIRDTLGSRPADRRGTERED